ncbi:MAG: hypothetical protein KDA24_16390 [Deltaproteobacteria bacterium]|nr:hypothetical protein [Deltaproteobacteria bacterium]
MRWLLGAAPWVVIVIFIAVIDGGCASVEPEDLSEEPTPFPDYGDDDTPQADDDDLGGPYPAVLRPDFDEVGVSRLSPLYVEFSEEGVNGAVTLLDPEGEEVAGTSIRVGAVRFLFVPDLPLRPEATYTMSTTWGEDDALSWDFTTRAAREPVGAPAGITLRWGIEAAAASSPPGAEAFVSQLPLGILTELDGQPLSMLAGLSEEGEPVAQDLCVATFEPTSEEPAVWEDPLLATPPVVLRLSVDLSIVGFGIQVLPLRDVRFAAELEGDASGITGIAEGSFIGWVDAREVAVPGVCETLGGVAIECTPCPGDGEEQCLVFALEEIGGDVVDVELQERSVGDVKSDPACQPQQ